MKKRIAILLALVVLFTAVSPAAASPLSSTAVWSVVKNESVTMRLADFPADETFDVYMGYRDTKGINGQLVSKLTTNAGGTFLAKFIIPDQFINEDIVSIRFESQDSIKYWYNFFYNTTVTVNPSTTTETDDGVKYNQLEPGFPTFTITSVTGGFSVSLVTKYFPPHDRWAVFIEDGTKNVYNNWIEVAGINVAEGGSFPVTFSIPSSLQYKELLAIMFYRLKDGFRTYDLILNQDYP